MKGYSVILERKSDERPKKTRVTVDPGICGFLCVIETWKESKGIVSLNIKGSECKQIQHLSTLLNKIALKELFGPLTRNPVYVSAQRAGCHPSCLVPVAVLKAAEVAMEMALPRDVVIKFES